MPHDEALVVSVVIEPGSEPVVQCNVPVKSAQVKGVLMAGIESVIRAEVNHENEKPKSRILVPNGYTGRLV